MEKVNRKPFSKDSLYLENVEQVIEKITQKMRDDVFGVSKRRGGVIGISGGIDSAVTMALAAKAFGPEKVFAVMMPEQDSSSDSEDFARKLAAKFGVEAIVENLTPALDGFQCYERRDEAFKKVIPSFDPKKHKAKIGIKKTSIFNNLPPIFYATVIKEDGSEIEKMLPAKEYMQIVASSNFKQRCRMSMLYYHAERLHYAVLGTPNKHEVDQGFFVKYGDGGADLMPIGDLYKTQVYQIAKHMGVPQDIIDRTPTTDTYSAEQTQEEFFYQFPHETLDLLWYAYENKYPAKEVGAVMGYTDEEIESIFRNFTRKIQTTEYLRMPPIKNYNVI